MKNVIWSTRSLLLLLLFSLLAENSFAGQPFFLRIKSMYSGPIPYVVFALVIGLILYMGYRYWHDSSSINE